MMMKDFVLGFVLLVFMTNNMNVMNVAAAFTAKNRVFVGTPAQVGRRLVKDCMSPKLTTLTTSTPLDDAIGILLEQGISGAPVVADRDGGEEGECRIVGLVSSFDFLQKEAGEGILLPIMESSSTMEGYMDAAKKICARSVGDIMTTNVITIESNESMRKAASMMAQHKLHRLPVTDNGNLVGMLTLSDILRDVHRVTKNLPPARTMQDTPMP